MSSGDWQTVRVHASARLHMGFYDLQSSGRFGGVGLALDSPLMVLELAREEVSAGVAEEQAALEQICQILRIESPVHMRVLQTIPRHAGLGSGTQLAMAIAMGLSRLFGLGLQAKEVARLLGRGRRSGIGIAAFAEGGFLADDGKDTAEEAPGLAGRLDFPEDWRIILVMDSAHIGVHGSAEKQAFQTLKPASGNLRDMVFAHMLPALERRDLLAFGAYMADLQAYNGDYFAPVQGGRYASRDVESVLRWMGLQGVACVGQSSWGPTGFAIVESQLAADKLLSQAQLAFASKSNIRFKICCSKNYGAKIIGVKDV